MPFSFLFRKRRAAEPLVPQPSVPQPRAVPPTAAQQNDLPADIRRYFHNQRGFQCYTSWFAHWGGWISAGHCVSDASGHVADFATGEVVTWPGGLDAALVGCTLPAAEPELPVIGRRVVLIGYPAGSRVAERREAIIYHERMPGQWIAHITTPDEPVVTGMSGGAVIDAQTGQPIGIIITRNSPADLNNDRDPDESADFISLSAVWATLQNGAIA